MRATERIDLSAELWHGTTTRDNLPRRACRCFRHHHHHYHHHHRRRLYNRYSCLVGDGACRPAGDAAATSTTLFRPRSSSTGCPRTITICFHRRDTCDRRVQFPPTIDIFLPLFRSKFYLFITLYIIIILLYNYYIKISILTKEIFAFKFRHLL